MTKVLELQQENDIPKKSNRGVFYLGMLFMWLLIVARNVLSINIPVLAILAVGVIIAMLGDRDEIIALAVCCIPMSNSFQYKYLILLCILIYAIKFFKDIKISSAILPLLLMMIWELLHGIKYDFSIYEFLRNFSELIFITFLMLLKPRKIDFPFIVRILAWVSIGMMLIILANLLIESKFDLEAIFNGYYRFGKFETGAENFRGTYNPNQLGMICNLAIASIMILIINKTAIVADYVALSLLVVFGIMTMSRAFLLCLALLAILFVFATKESILKKIRTVLILLLIVVIVFMVVKSAMPYVIEQFLGRFEEDDLLNGRDTLFSFYNEHIFSSVEYLLFGIGIQDFAEKFDALYDNNYNVAHNGTQEIVICWGIVGLVLFVYFLIKIIESKNSGKRKLCDFLPLLLILIYVQSGQLITNGMALLAFSLAYTALQTNYEG